MSRILCIGDLMLDVVVKIESPINYGTDTPSRISMHGGGGAANTASWLASTGHEVFFVGRTGVDAAADSIIQELDSWNIKHNSLRKTGLTTGVVVVIVDSSGERTMFPDSGANSGLGVADLPELKGFDAAYLSGYSLFNEKSTKGVLEIITELKRAGIPIFFDPASVGTISHFGKSAAIEYLGLMDILLLNEDESLFLSEQQSYEMALNTLLEFSSIVVIKRGSLGAVAKMRSSSSVEVPTVEVSPIDTTGAGDAFAAGFIPEWLAKQDLYSALNAANTLAGRCVLNIGARPSVNPR